MIKKLLNILSLVIVGILLLGSPVWADTFSNYMAISVLNNGTTVYPAIPILASINNAQMYSQGYMLVTGLDTNMQEGASNTPYMVDTVNTGIGTAGFATGQRRTYFYRLNNVPPQTGFPVIVGYGGNVTVTDSPTLELGNNFTYSTTGYIDTTAGANKNLLYKPGAIRVSTNETINGQVDASISSVALPTSYTDLSGVWTNEVNAFDNNTATFASCLNIPVLSWSGYLGLNRAAVSISNVWVYPTRSNAAVNLIEVGVWYGGGWNTIYSGAFTSGIWVGCPIGSLQTVTAARVRFYNADGGTTYHAYVNEFSFGPVDLVVSASGITSSDIVQVSANVANLTISINGVERGTILLNGLGITNTTNSYILMAGNSMVYASSTIISINGTQQLWFQPVQMPTGTALPDRSGNGHNGVIAWGTNPTGIEVTIGAITSSSSTTYLSGNGTEILPTVVVIPDVTLYENTAEKTNMPQYALFKPAADSLEWTTNTLYGFFMIGTAIVMFIAGVVTTSVPIIGGAIALSLLGMAASTEIIPAILVGAIAVLVISLIVIVKRN